MQKVAQPGRGTNDGEESLEFVANLGKISTAGRGNAFCSIDLEKD